MDTKSQANDKKQQNLMDWKKPYLELLIDELHPAGDTLEVGFGLGDAANRIQSFKPKSHTIIETDPQLAEKAKAWANKQNHVKVIQGSWSEVLPQLGTFDAIFFNDYPSNCELEMLSELSSEEVAEFAKKAKILLQDLEQHLSEVSVKFTDNEIDDFYHKIGQHNSKELAKFFNHLKERGHITKIQHENAIKKYQLQNQAKNVPNEAKPTDPMLPFLEECVKKHMKAGSRFSSFSIDSKSKFEDPLFFDRIITNPNFDYSENMTSLKTSNGKTKEVLLFVIKKI